MNSMTFVKMAGGSTGLFGDFRDGIIVVTVVAVFIVGIVLFRRYISKQRAQFDKMVEDAVRQGHVVKGNRIECKRHRHRHNRGKHHKTRYHTSYSAVYEYQVNGASYTYSISGLGSQPSETVDIYYTDNPGRGFTEWNRKTGNCLASILIYVVPIAAGVLVAKLLGA